MVVGRWVVWPPAEDPQTVISAAAPQSVLPFKVNQHKMDPNPKTLVHRRLNIVIWPRSFNDDRLGLFKWAGRRKLGREVSKDMSDPARVPPRDMKWCCFLRNNLWKWGSTGYFHLSREKSCPASSSPPDHVQEESEHLKYTSNLVCVVAFFELVSSGPDRHRWQLLFSSVGTISGLPVPVGITRRWSSWQGKINAVVKVGPRSARSQSSSEVLNLVYFVTVFGESFMIVLFGFRRWTVKLRWTHFGIHTETGMRIDVGGGAWVRWGKNQCAFFMNYISIIKLVTKIAYLIFLPNCGI